MMHSPYVIAFCQCPKCGALFTKAIKPRGYKVIEHHDDARQNVYSVRCPKHVPKGRNVSSHQPGLFDRLDKGGR